MEKPEGFTDAQWAALHRLYERSNDIHSSFESLAATAQLSTLMDCVMVPWCGMWIGIERDGYTHS
jgi:hypothetical protein